MDVCTHCKKPFQKKYRDQAFCSLPCSNRYHLNNKNYFELPIGYSENLAELFGILLGDGSVTKYYVKIYLNMKVDVGYSKNIISILKKLFPTATPTISIRPKRGTEEIQISSKALCDYLRSIGFNPKTRTIPAWISDDIMFTKAVIRGLFDTEGSVGIKHVLGKNGDAIYKQLTVTNKNKNILAFLEKGLIRFGFSPTKNSLKNIYLSNKSDINKYFRMIGTSNPKLEKKSSAC